MKNKSCFNCKFKKDLRYWINIKDGSPCIKCFDFSNWKGRKIMKRTIITLKNDWKKFKWRFIYSKKKRDRLLAEIYPNPIKKVKDYYQEKKQ